MASDQTNEKSRSNGTIVKYRSATAEEIAQEEEWYREKQSHDEASAITDAWLEGWVQGFLKSRLKALSKDREAYRQNGEEFPTEKIKAIRSLKRLLTRLKEGFVSDEELVGRVSKIVPDFKVIYDAASKRAEEYYASYLLKKAENLNRE